MEERKMRVAIYCRVGNAEQTRMGVNCQKSLIDNSLDNTNKNAIRKYYVDNGFSGLNFNRPSFKKLVNDIDKNKIDSIYVKDFSRISRNIVDLLSLTEEKLKSKNIKLISVTEHNDTLNIQSEIYRKFISNICKKRRVHNGR